MNSKMAVDGIFILWNIMGHYQTPVKQNVQLTVSYQKKHRSQILNRHFMEATGAIFIAMLVYMMVVVKQMVDPGQ